MEQFGRTARSRPPRTTSTRRSGLPAPRSVRPVTAAARPWRSATARSASPRPVEVWVDATAFDAAARGANDNLDDLLAARAMYVGEPLPDDRYADWATGARESLAQDHLALLARIAELQERAGWSDAATDALRELLELEPTDEAAHRSLMRVYALGDRRQLALRQFERLRTILARELDVEPADASRLLYRDILEGRLGAAAATTSGPAATTGEPAVRSSPPSADRPTGVAPRGRGRTTCPSSSAASSDENARSADRTAPAGGPGPDPDRSRRTGKTRLAIEAAAHRRWHAPRRCLAGRARGRQRTRPGHPGGRRCLRHPGVAG